VILAHRVRDVVGYLVDVHDEVDVEYELHRAEFPNQRGQSGHHRAAAVHTTGRWARRRRNGDVDDRPLPDDDTDQRRPYLARIRWNHKGSTGFGVASVTW
jgi:hypothetical protein